MKRLFIMALTIVLICAAFCVTAGAVEEAGFTVTPSKTTVKAGDTLTIKVKLTESYTAKSGNVQLTLPPNFEFVSGVWEGDAATALIQSFNANGAGVFSLQTAKENLTGDLCTLTVKAKEASTTAFAISVKVILKNGTPTVAEGTKNTSKISVQCVTHSYGDFTKTDNTYHSRTCTVCGNVDKVKHAWDAGITQTPATCKDPGTKVHTCSVCRATKNADIPKTNDHKYGEFTKLDGTYHGRTCSVCNNVDKVKHKWNSGTVQTPATCKDPGTKVHTCSVCRGTKNTDIPKTNDHVFTSYTKVNDKKHKATCTVCNKPVETEHKWNAGTVTKPASCKETGIKSTTCTLCKHETNVEIPKTNDHKYGDWSKKDDLIHTHTCSECNNTEEAEHNWDEGTVTKPASGTEEGEVKYVCKSCGAEKTEKIPVITESETTTPPITVKPETTDGDEESTTSIETTPNINTTDTELIPPVTDGPSSNEGNKTTLIIVIVVAAASVACVAVILVKKKK